MLGPMRWFIDKALLPSLTTELNFVSQFKTVGAQNSVMVSWSQRQESQQQSAGARPRPKAFLPILIVVTDSSLSTELEMEHCYL